MRPYRTWMLPMSRASFIMHTNTLIS